MPKYSGNNYELRIGRTKMEDKGEYVVKAVNSYGSVEECALLNVERKQITLMIARAVLYTPFLLLNH